MTHCVDFCRKWKREPNFCGLGSTSAKSYDKYITFVESFSRQYNIPQETVYLNVPHGSVKELLKFRPDSDIRKRAEEQIAKTLNDKKGTTGIYVKKLIGMECTPKPIVQTPIVAAVSEIPKEVFDTTRLKDRIRLINGALTAGQLKILLEIMEKENLDNEYEAVTKALIWAKERMDGH